MNRRVLLGGFAAGASRFGLRNGGLRQARRLRVFVRMSVPVRFVRGRVVPLVDQADAANNANRAC